ncbi:hypothetical protein QYM36_019957, partial [Artemia franciscana]
LEQSKNIFVVAIQFENLTKARNKTDPSFLSWEDAHPGGIKITRVISSTDLLLSRIDGLPQTFGTGFDTGLGLGLAADLSQLKQNKNIFVVAIQFENLTKARNKMDPSFLSWEDAHPGAIKITRVISSTDMLLSRIDGLPQTFGTRFDAGLELGLAADLSQLEQSKNIFVVAIQFENLTKARNKTDPSFLSWEDAHPGAIKITRVISSTDLLLSRIDGLPQTFGTGFDTGLGLGLAADLSQLEQSKNIFVVAIQFENLTKARNKTDPSFLSWEDAHPGAIEITRVISSTDLLLSRIDGLPQTFGTGFDTGLGLGLAADLSQLKQSKNIFVVAIQCENLTKARNKMDPSFLSWEDPHPGAIEITRVILSTDMLLSRIDGLPQTFGTGFDTGLGLGLAADLPQ